MNNVFVPGDYMKLNVTNLILLLSLSSFMICDVVSNSVEWDFNFVQYKATVYATKPYNDTLIFFLDVKSYNESAISSLGVTRFEIYLIRLSTKLKSKDVYDKVILGEMNDSVFYLYDRILRVNFDLEEDSEVTAVFWFNITYATSWTVTWRSIALNITILGGVETHNIDFTFGFENVEKNPINLLLIGVAIIEAGIIIMMRTRE